MNAATFVSRIGPGILCLTACLLCAAPVQAQPDVIYSNINITQNHGVVGDTRAYTLGTQTCNVGDENLSWVFRGTPAVAFNMYRLADGRLMQIGMSWVKHACCVANTGGCGLDCPMEGDGLRAGCMDTYTASWNAQQSYLGPRSGIDPYAAAFADVPTNTGNAIFKRLQVKQTELEYPTALFFVGGVYVCAEESMSAQQLNNASHRRVTVNQTSFNLTLQNSTQIGIPAIQAWQDHGLGANTPDPSVSVFTVDVPDEGRFWAAAKVTDLGGGQYLYDYALFNLNSDLAGGSLSVPLPATTSVSNPGFHAPPYHSGEIYSNTPWTITVEAAGVTWHSPQTFAQNPNTNALRWGTMYNFWFTADRPPAVGSAAFGLFKPHDPQSLSLTVPVPAGCGNAPGDLNGDTLVNGEDIHDFVACLLTGSAPGADCACGDMDADSVLDSDDADAFAAALLNP
jgi:hypothetical protein